MLHGRAASAELQQRVLEATGWTNLGMTFECIDGPEVVPPAPELFQALHKGGLYDERSYLAWGLQRTGSDRAMVEASVTLVKRELDIHAPVDGLAGICDGAIVAALVRNAH